MRINVYHKTDDSSMAIGFGFQMWPRVLLIKRLARMLGVRDGFRFSSLRLYACVRCLILSTFSRHSRLLTKESDYRIRRRWLGSTYRNRTKVPELGMLQKRFMMMNSISTRHAQTILSSCLWGGKNMRVARAPFYSYS